MVAGLFAILLALLPFVIAYVVARRVTNNWTIVDPSIPIDPSLLEPELSRREIEERAMVDWERRFAIETNRRHLIDSHPVREVNVRVGGRAERHIVPRMGDLQLARRRRDWNAYGHSDTGDVQGNPREF